MFNWLRRRESVAAAEQAPASPAEIAGLGVVKR